MNLRRKPCVCYESGFPFNEDQGNLNLSWISRSSWLHHVCSLQQGRWDFWTLRTKNIQPNSAAISPCWGASEATCGSKWSCPGCLEPANMSASTRTASLQNSDMCAYLRATAVELNSPLFALVLADTTKSYQTLYVKILVIHRSPGTLLWKLNSNIRPLQSPHFCYRHYKLLMSVIIHDVQNT